MSYRLLTGIACLSLMLGACADGEVAQRGERGEGWETYEEMGGGEGEDLGLEPEPELDAQEDWSGEPGEDMGFDEDLSEEPPEEPEPEPEDPAEEEDTGPTAPEEPPQQPDPQEPNNSKVKTADFTTLHWNIAGGKENGCRPNEIRRAVMRFVRESNTPVDFISLNEVCAAQYEEIHEALRVYWKKDKGARFAAFQPSGGSRVGNAFFSRQNVKDITRQELGTDQYGKRYLLCGLQINRRVRVCTTHLTPADGAARTQLAKVITRIEQWWQNRSDTVIIGGDLNIHPNDVGLNKMYAPGANTPNNPGNTGAYREVDDDDAQNCRGYGERTTPGTTGGPCRSGGKIDFTFVRANRIVNNNYKGDSLNIPDDCTGVCSDHRPLRGFAKIRFRTD